MIRKIFKWIFKNELKEINLYREHLKILDEAYEKTHKSQTDILENQTNLLELLKENSKRINNILENIDVSVDMHVKSPSWAVISIQGEKSDYIKFIDLGQSDIREIQSFLSKFDRRKVKVDMPHSMIKNQLFKI